jgi:hypothetical protein
MAAAASSPARRRRSGGAEWGANARERPHGAGALNDSSACSEPRLVFGRCQSPDLESEPVTTR